MDHVMMIISIVIAAMFGAAGVAIGKAWGSYGKQTTVLCNIARESCRETLYTKLDAIVGERNAKLEAILERLRRIEEHVLNNRGKHE